MVAEEATDLGHGEAVATINGEVAGDTMQDHPDHGVIPPDTAVAGVVAGEMEHMVVVEKRKDLEVEEEEEEVIRINATIFTPYTNIYTI